MNLHRYQMKQWSQQVLDTYEFTQVSNNVNLSPVEVYVLDTYEFTQVSNPLGYR